MKLIIYIKTTLRNMMANGAVMLLSFIGFPIIMAGFMGFIQGNIHETPLKINKIEINIIDEDNSDMSKALINFIKSDNISEFIGVSEDNKGKADLIIPKGYEENLLSQKKNNLKIKREDEGKRSIDTLKIILDRYHQDMYQSFSGGSVEELSKIDMGDTINNVFIDKKENVSPYQYFASSMLAFIIIMLVQGQITAGSQNKTKNFSNRTLTAPITRRELFIYNFLSYVVFASILIGGYVLFFRLAGIAFAGNLLSLIILIISSSILASALITFVQNIFPEKAAMAIGYILFIIPIIGMEMFTMEGNALAKFTPTHYISKAFESYTLNGSLVGAEKYILYILGVALILFLITIIKESLVKGAKKCV